ncbi:MAG: hypothetical protein ACP5QG_08475, partial [candidate division WOR-3 bacterium]
MFLWKVFAEQVRRSGELLSLPRINPGASGLWRSGELLSLPFDTPQWKVFAEQVRRSGELLSLPFDTPQFIAGSLMSGARTPNL